MKIRSLMAAESVEMEGVPEEQGRKFGKSIRQVGTQFCIVSDNPRDRNFGCWPSREKAEAVMSGKSFIEDDIPGNLFAGGPGSGRRKEKLQDQAMQEYQRTYKLAKAVGYTNDQAHQAATENYLSKLKGMQAGGPGSGRRKGEYATSTPELREQQYRDLERFVDRTIQEQSKAGVKGAAGNMPQTGWQYGKRTMPVGYIPQRTLSGFPSGKGGGRGGLPRVKPTGTPRPHPMGTKPVAHAKPAATVPSGTGHRLPNPSMRSKLGVGHKFTLENSKVKAFADLGEPMAGALGHMHMDTNLWFKPPSAKRTKPIPTDDPQEKDDRFLDVTKRKAAGKDRAKLMKRLSPAGLPALIPAKTTLIEPHAAVYMPGMFNSAIKLRPRRDVNDARMRVSFDRQGCI